MYGPFRIHDETEACVCPSAPDAEEVPPPLYRHVETSVMESGVTIVGILVCAAVVAAAVVFAVVQKRYWRQVPKYSAASEESPAHMAHSSSAQSSQPSSPGPQVQVDMDIPLTGESGGRHGVGRSGYLHGVGVLWEGGGGGREGSGGGRG